MFTEAEIEFDRFEEDYKAGLKKDKSNNYLILDNYADEFPNSEISKAQNALSKAIESFLEEKGDDNYRVYYDWCVHVMHNELDKSIKEESRQIANNRKKRFEGSRKISKSNVNGMEFNPEHWKVGVRRDNPKGVGSSRPVEWVEFEYLHGNIVIAYGEKETQLENRDEIIRIIESL